MKFSTLALQNSTPTRFLGHWPEKYKRRVKIDFKRKMKILKVSKDEWISNFSEQAHLISFERSKPKDFDRIDYALLCIEDTFPRGYITVRELDHETVYWQFGGAFPGTKDGIFAVKGYDYFLEFQSTLSKRMTTKIENTNYPMLKLALSRGLLIVGCGHYNGTTLLDLVKEW